MLRLARAGRPGMYGTSVQPSGKPINVSTHSGLSRPRLPSWPSMPGPLWSRATGVGQADADTAQPNKLGWARPSPDTMSAVSFAALALCGVCQVFTAIPSGVPAPRLPRAALRAAQGASSSSRTFAARGDGHIACRASPMLVNLPARQCAL